MKKKVLVIDLSGKVDNYDKALVGALTRVAPSEQFIVRLLIPGKGLLRLVPKRFNQTEFIVKRILKAVETLLNYIIVGFLLIINKASVVHFQWLPFMEVIGVEKYILQFFHIISSQTKYILTMHNIYPHGMKMIDDRGKRNYKNRFISACKLIDILIVHTEYSKKEAIKEFGIDGTKIMVVYHGVFTPQYVINSSCKSIQRRMTYLQFGLQTYYKGTDVFVEAVNMLPPSYQNQIEARIVGGISETYLKELKEKDIASLFKFKPYFLSNEELYDEISNCDVILLPYREISQSGVLLLAIYFKKFIICSDIPSFVETMRGQADNSLDKEIFFKNEDPHALCELIKKYLDNGIHESSIRKRIVDLNNLYSWENTAISTLKIYNKLSNHL